VADESLPHTYRPARWLQVAMSACGLLEVAGGLFLGLRHFVPHPSFVQRAIGVGMGSLLIVAGVFTIATTVTSRTTLEVDAIETSWAFWRRKRITRVEILGFRVVPESPLPAVRFVRREPARRTFDVMFTWKIDERTSAWLASFTNLDAEEQSKQLQELAKVEGADVQRRITRAKNLVSWLGLATLLAVLLPLFSHGLSAAVSFFVCATMPWIGLALTAVRPNLFTFSNTPNKVRAELFSLIMIPGVGMALPAFRVTLARTVDIAAWAVPVGVVFGVVCILSMRDKSVWASAFVMLFACAYGYGLCTVANVFFDHERPTPSRVQLRTKKEGWDKRKTFEIVLAPTEWMSEREMRVSQAFYESVHEGDMIDVAVHQGALGAKWITAGPYPTPSKSQ
jgi:hypothetical protein